jgi:hypothetical protein
LYINARWHGFAKLRMHTDATLILFEQMTAQLRDAFREFIRVVDSINTVELQKEADQRARAAAKKRAKAQANAGAPSPTPPTQSTFRIVQPAPQPEEPALSTSVANDSRSGNTRRPKKLNISTVKFHTLGHYLSNIRSFSPTDIYSTEWVSSAAAAWMAFTLTD